MLYHNGMPNQSIDSHYDTTMIYNGILLLTTTQNGKVACILWPGFLREIHVEFRVI